MGATIKGPVATLLGGVTVTGAGGAVNASQVNRAKRTFHGVVAGTGAVAATIAVEVSNNGTDWLTLGTITLSGTTRANDGFASDAPWALVRGNMTAISGTGAAVTLLMGV